MERTIAAIPRPSSPWSGGGLKPYMLYRRENRRDAGARLGKTAVSGPEYFKGCVPGPSDAAIALWRHVHVTGTITRVSPFMMNTRTGYAAGDPEPDPRKVAGEQLGGTQTG